MSEQEQERPLTRREMRMREQAAREAAGIEASESASETEQAQVEEPLPEESPDRAAAEELVSEIEISPLNEDGTPRSRREIRQLREAALAELLGDQVEAAPEEPADEEVNEAPAAEPEAEGETEAAEEPEAETDEEPEVETDEVPAAETEAEAEEAEAPEAPTPDEAEPVDAGVPTEAFTLADVREAEAALEQSDDGADLPPTEAMSLGDLLDTGEELEPTGESESVAALFAAEEDSSAPEPEAEPQGDAQGSEVAEAPASEDELAYAFEGEPSTQTSEYSFPDIQPPEEWRSVFDDPSRGAELAGSDGDFDDLISRAVAQEGSTGSTGVSALILPSHPEDTGGLAGPLGATGDLYVTGSIELPKSIGETGGHASLHDSLEIDPFLTGGQTGSMGADQTEGPVPVSARSAVSARRNPEVPVVAEPTKDKSKMPVVLALTGGGLLIVLAGAAVYMATQGMFG